jgi:hypothetical protein
VRFYEIDDGGGQKTEARAKFDHRAAVLACSFSADAAHAFSGGLDTVVKEYVSFRVHYLLIFILTRTDWICRLKR